MKPRKSIFSMEFDVVVPLGDNCRLAEALKDLNMRTISLPFDWCNSCPYSVYIAIKENFEKFYHHDYIQMISPGLYLNAEYGLQFTHESPDLETSQLKYQRRGRRFMDILHSTTRRVLFLAQTLDCRDLIDPDNAPANSHAKFCRATFGDYPCSPAYFEEIYDLIRIINPDLDFEMVAVNYDRTSQFQSEKIKFWTLPFSPYAKAPLGPRKPDREALHALLSEVKMTNHHYAQKIC